MEIELASGAEVMCFLGEGETELAHRGWGLEEAPVNLYTISINLKRAFNSIVCMNVSSHLHSKVPLCLLPSLSALH